MREIGKVLDLFSTGSTMEYCQDFDEIKSVLEYCNKYVKPFNRLHFRSGNQEYIDELTKRLLDILVKHNYVKEDTHEPLSNANEHLRKIVMFFIANADITYKYNLRQDENYAHIIEICPVMPKFLLINIIWDLKLDKYFIEMLHHAPYWFTFQYFEIASESLKYVEDPYEILIKVEQLLDALFMCVTRMMRQTIDIIDCRVTCNKLYDTCTTMLRQFYTPDMEKFKHFKKKQNQRYIGYLMMHLLRSVKFLFDVYESGKSPNPVPDYAAFYNVCGKLCPFIDAQKSQKINETVKEQQQKILTLVLNSLQYNLMLVNLESFIYWVEIDIDENTTLQQYIGELAYNTEQRILGNMELSHDVSAQLHMIALKPKTIEEQIEEANIGEMLLALERNDLPKDVQHKWLDGLIGRNVLTLFNEECLQTIKENVQLLQVQNIKDMLKCIQQYRYQQSLSEEEETVTDAVSLAASTLICKTPEVIEDMTNESEDFADIINIFLMALDNFNEAEMLELLIYQVELFGFNEQLFCLNQSNYQQRLNKFLLKHNTIENFNISTFLKICFEGAQMMWEQLFEKACNMGESLKLLSHVIEQTKFYAVYFIPQQLKMTISNSDKLHQPLVTEVLCNLYFLMYQPSKSEDFLEHYMHKHMRQMIETENFADLLPLVITLNKIAKHGETQSHKPLNFGNYICPMLLTVARALDLARWNLINYTEERHQLVCECIDFIQYNNKLFLPKATDGDRQFISNITKDQYSNFVQYYFQKYSLNSEENPKNFDEFIVTEDCSTYEVALSTLLMNIIRCTKKETEWLARSERFLPTFGDALIMLSIVVEETENESQKSALLNYRRCLANFALVVKKFMLPAAKDSIENLDELLFKVLKVIAAIPKTIYDETFLSILWLPLEIVETYMKDINFELYKRIISFMGTVNESKAKSVFCEKLEALVAK